MVNSKSPFMNFLRDWGLWLVQLIPAVRKRLELGARVYGPTRYTYSDGMGFIAELGGGVSFAQSFCVEVGQKEQSRVQFTDDVIFAPHKNNMFQIVVLLNDIDQVANAQAQLNGLNATCSHLSPKEATYFVHRKAAGSSVATDVQGHGRIFRVASAGEFSHSDLNTGRPEPEGYREDDMWRGFKHKTFVILRLDRFVFAACKDRKELEMVARKMDELFPSH